jgi:hypothetical protein
VGGRLAAEFHYHQLTFLGLSAAMDAAPNNPTRVRQLDLTTSCDHVVFASSSGHCSLDCTYCIASPVVKHQPTLTYEDFAFLFEQLGGRTFLILSGKGDFFAGYRKNERLLERLLNHDIEMPLDINGVMLHELPELPTALLAKIRFVNLTMHYRQLLAKRALDAWARNARLLMERLGGARLLSGYILTPGEQAQWRAALDFYRHSVFEPTGQPLMLILDVQATFDADLQAEIGRLVTEFSPMIEEVHQVDFSVRFAQYPQVLCPAGAHYFRIWNDGRVDGCPYVEARRDCGNLKERRLTRHQGLFACREARYCDCNDIALVGKMVFPPAEGGQ